MQRPLLRQPVTVLVGLRKVIAGIQEHHGHVGNALAPPMQDDHILRLKAAGQASTGFSLSGEHRVQSLLGRETFHYLRNSVYAHLVHLSLILSRGINKPQRLCKREDLLPGPFLVAVERGGSGQIKKTIGEFRGDAAFSISRESVAGIKDDNSRVPRHANRLGKLIAGKFKTTQVQHLESALEEKTFEPNRESGTVFEEKNGWKMAMTSVSFLGRNGSVVHGGGDEFLFRFSRNPYGGHVFLNHPRAHGGVRGSVDQNEAARCSVARIGIEKQGDMGLEFHGTDFIQFQQ